MTKQYLAFNKTIYIDPNTSNFSFFENLLETKSEENQPFLYDESIIRPKTVTLCVNVSSMCNLSCDYCFNDQKTSTSLSLDSIKGFLADAFLYFSECEKFFVDLSGKGEPLLFLETILKINRYCIEFSNKIRKEILVSFVSNGVLLLKAISNVLQKEGILFGVSLDGTRLNHDLHRKDKAGNGTFDKIIENIRDIENHDYVGCAITLTKNVFDLTSTLVELNRYFKTISVKPSRTCSVSFDRGSLSKWLNEYDKLTLYMLNQCLCNKDTTLLFCLLNGDDYFGKFLFRCFLNQRVLTRCDAGVGRITLNCDENLYLCPASSMYITFRLNRHFAENKEIVSDIYSKQLKKKNCSDCPFKYLCGGECLVELKINNDQNNLLMCEYKKHLILLAMYFQQMLLFKDLDLFLKIRTFCEEKVLRYGENKELSNFLNMHPSLNFTEGKKEFDSINKKY